MTSSFQTLIAELGAPHGLQAGDGTYGLQFESEGHTLRVQAHPAREDRLVIEVEVATLSPEAGASPLALLLQINHAARFEHGWRLSLDEEQQVHLGTTAETGGLTAAELQALMLDGLERAQLVRDLLDALAEGQTQTPPPSAADIPMIRG